MRPFRPADFIERAGVYLLACVGGCIDAIGFLTLGSLFVAHTEWQYSIARRILRAWAVGAGAASSARLADLYSRHPAGASLARLAAGLGHCCADLTLRSPPAHEDSESRGGFAGNPALNTPAFYAFASMPLLAMGLQNSSIRTIGNVTFHTTYVTGVVDLFAESSAKYLRNRSPDAAKTARQAALVWLCYAGGGAIGSAGLLFLKAGIFALPVAILLMLACPAVAQRPTAFRARDMTPSEIPRAFSKPSRSTPSTYVLSATSSARRSRIGAK